MEQNTGNGEKPSGLKENVGTEHIGANCQRGELNGDGMEQKRKRWQPDG